VKLIDSKELFSVSDQGSFEALSLEIFHYQVRKNEVYGRFVANLGLDIEHIKDFKNIPYLPIEFFKSQKIVCGDALPEAIFSSSGTSGMVQSQHLVNDVSIYVESYRKAFQLFYGDIKDYALLALLPSYQEREGSSLIYMIDDLLKQSQEEKSGYFLYDHQALKQSLEDLKKSKTPTILIGVTYALLDFVESFQIEFPELIVMETGGMKGKRKELLRAELHEILCTGFGVKSIHSEYGMTELLSQAYSKGNGIFYCPPWMKISVRDTNDPLSLLGHEQTGGINIIDFANINSCSFLATQDLGKTYSNGSFEILGRFDNSDIRGCNLLVQN